jgi:hypothetical protein
LAESFGNPFTNESRQRRREGKDRAIDQQEQRAEQDPRADMENDQFIAKLAGESAGVVRP